MSPRFWGRLKAGSRTHGTSSAAAITMVVRSAAALSMDRSDEVGGNSTNTNAMMAAPANGATRPAAPGSLSGCHTASGPVEISPCPRCPSLVRAAVDVLSTGSFCTVTGSCFHCSSAEMWTWRRPADTASLADANKPTSPSPPATDRPATDQPEPESCPQRIPQLAPRPASFEAHIQRGSDSTGTVDCPARRVQRTATHHPFG